MCICCCQWTHRGHWLHRLQPTSTIIMDAKLVDSNLYDFAMQGWRWLNRGADIITGLSRRHPWRFSKGYISCYLKDISTYLSCTAQRVLRTIFMQKYKPKYACLPSKIIEVWIDRFCVPWCDGVKLYYVILYGRPSVPLIFFFMGCHIVLRSHPIPINRQLFSCTITRFCVTILYPDLYTP